MAHYRKRGEGRSRKKPNGRLWERAGAFFLLFLVVLGVGGLTAGGIYGWNRWRGGKPSEPIPAAEIKREVAKEAFPSDPTKGSGGSGLSSQEQARKKLEQMTLEEKVSQLFVITPEALTGYSSVTAAGAATKEAYDRYPVGGLVYFSENLESETQVKDMVSNTKKYAMDRIGIPVLISVDEEGGTVARIGNNPAFQVPKVGNMAEIGGSKDPTKAYEAGKTLGTYLSGMGFNLDFAPVADVYNNPENTVVAKRAFGTKGVEVAAFSNELLRGLREKGVNGVLKHFPGHGSTAGDTHEGYAYTEKSLEELLSDDFIPFQKGIEAGADFVMVGHIGAPAVTGDETPATLSPVLLTDILRGQLGFEGIIITDALNMGAIVDSYTPEEAAVKALEAGVDMLLMPGDFQKAYQGVLTGVKEGRLSQNRLDQSVYRILEVKFRTLK